MECKAVKKTFRVLGVKGSGAFANFGTEIPKLAQQFLGRLDEIKNHSGIEIALFEPKMDVDHLEGYFYVGVMVNGPLDKVPVGMDYIETTHDYVTTRSEMNNIGNVHNILLKWTNDQGYKRDLEAYIIETYHPMENGVEEVEIYLPITT
jgi:predicted transcriptional regulator YdeE